MRIDAAQSETVAAPAQAPAPPRVLIVDDALTVRRFHKVISEGAGYAVAEAGNGMEALEQALADPPHLFVVDVNMPQMDGYAFLRAVRATEPLKGIPAVMVSTEGKHIDRQKAYAAGANIYLVKPADPDRLTALLTLLRPEARVCGEADAASAASSEDATP